MCYAVSIVALVIFKFLNYMEPEETKVEGEMEATPEMETPVTEEVEGETPVETEATPEAEPQA